MKNNSVLSSKKTQPTFVELIQKKRDGGEFSEEEIRRLVDAINDAEIPEHQLAALIMAIYFKGLSAQEQASLAEEIMLSGEVVGLEKVTKPKIDKYSTGGVGDKTSLVLPALAAACGVAMPSMISPSDEVGITTIEKLSSIKGFSGVVDLKAFVKQITDIRCAVALQSEDIAPVDDLIYKMCQQTATTGSLHLMTSSILARKMAEGAEGLVVDVKWGNGSTVKNLEEAKQLARAITRVARGMNRRSVALVTDMNQPLGDSVGFALEVKEAIELLKGKGPADLQDLIMKLGMEIVRLAGVAGSTLSAKQSIEKAFSTGSAVECFKAMVKAQGGDATMIDAPEKLPAAKFTKKLPAPKRGYVHTIDAKLICDGVRILAAGKNGLDYGVGVTGIQKVGAQIKQGESLVTIHYNDESQLGAAIELFREAYRLAPKRPNPSDLIIERVA